MQGYKQSPVGGLVPVPPQVLSTGVAYAPPSVGVVQTSPGVNYYFDAVTGLGSTQLSSIATPLRERDSEVDAELYAEGYQFGAQSSVPSQNVQNVGQAAAQAQDGMNSAGWLFLLFGGAFFLLWDNGG